MSKAISSLAVSDKIEVPVLSAYQSRFGAKIIFEVADKNHSGYPSNSVTLITEKIIQLMCSDAKEPSNSNSDRRNYGNNRHIHSNILQWLNSNATAGNWYSAKHSADAPPTNANVWDNYNEYDAWAGFLAMLDPKFVAELLDTTLTVVKSSTDGGSYETFTAKMFLASTTEVGLANENGIAEGALLALFSNNASRIAYPTAECVSNSEYSNSNFTTSKGWYWWLRTPNSSNAYNVRNVNSDGTLNNNNAYNGNRGVRPLRWKMRSSRHKPKAEYHHQRKVYPAAAIHSGGKYRIADAGAFRVAECKGYIQRGFFMTDYEKIYNFENLYRAYRKARQGKRWKGAAAKFEVNLLEALNLLSAQIRTKRYTMSPYNTFEVYEPKRRVVMSNSYKDKVVQHSLCDNVLEPILTRSFIRDNYASQVGKGTHYGLDRLQEFMRRFYRKNGIDGWILKGDISKYFYSIRHDVLKTLIREKITDPDVLWLIDLIIDSTEGNVGIPIGNQTSQLFALLYLDGLDHFVKEKLGIKYYGRYMDDFFLIHHDKAYLQECRKQIEAFVQARGLSLNAKTNIFPLKHGVDFLGFHTYLTESGAVIRKVRRRSKNNMKRKLKKLAALHAAGRIDAKTVEQSYQSWRGHAEKGNSYHLIRRTDQYYNSLMKSKEAAQCQKH